LLYKYILVILCAGFLQ